MISRYLVVIVLTIISTGVAAQAVFDDPRLDAFVRDSINTSSERRQSLAIQQQAMYEWVVRECMQSRGFSVNSDATSKEMSDALYGKYSYCQDHHIPGIDPPCPGNAVMVLERFEAAERHADNAIERYCGEDRDTNTDIFKNIGVSQQLNCK